MEKETKFVLVRHGETDYSLVSELGFKGNGLDLAPLSSNGINAVKNMAQRDAFSDASILISSPYTRAMQTASIIGLYNNLDINVEVLLHEWLPDLSFNYKTKEEFVDALRIVKCESLNNNCNNISIEALRHVRDRARQVLSKYLSYNKVIVVCHGIVISSLLDCNFRLSPAEYIEVNSKVLKLEKR